MEADLFSWRPPQQYDAVFFGFWISHIPAERFDQFWEMVRRSLLPSGRVFFFDDNYRTESELVDGPASPVVERRLLNGDPFRILKIPYGANELEDRLRNLGWSITVTSSRGPFYWAEGTVIR